MLPDLLPHYDPMPVLSSLSTPQLWILGADDLEAPMTETVRRLHALAASGKPVDIAIFPRAEHGIYEYETAADGTRLSTRNSEGYFAMMRDYILEGRLWRSYGMSVLHVSKPVRTDGLPLSEAAFLNRSSFLSGAAVRVGRRSSCPSRDRR